MTTQPTSEQPSIGKMTPEQEKRGMRVLVIFFLCFFLVLIAVAYTAVG